MTGAAGVGLEAGWQRPRRVRFLLLLLELSGSQLGDELSGMALRVLAISCRPLDKLPYADDAEVEDKLTAVLDGGLQFLGLVASIDPERQGVKDAIQEAAHASVRTVMITGDYLKTAQAEGSALP